MSDDTISNDGGSGGDPFRGAGSHIRFLITELIPILLASALKIPDVDEGRKRLIELITNAFKSKFGAAMLRLEMLIERLTKELARLSEERLLVQQRLAETPRWVAASQINHGRNADEYVETPFPEWQGRHQVEAILIFALLPLASGAALVTAKSNLEGTGLPIFLDGPLVWTMAMLAPLSGFAIKTMWPHLHREGLRRAFTYGLNSLAVIFILFWVWLYAVNFSGLTPEAGLAGFLDDPTWWEETRGTAFTVVTLLTEITVTSVLAHRLDKLAAFYSPNYWTENPEYIDLLERLKALNERFEILSTHLEDASGELAAYQASLDAQIDLAVLGYDARRGERNDPIL